jgi:SAM-dependent methyltransferase
MKALRTRPIPPTDYSYSHIDKGCDYQKTFEAWPGTALMWELEQRAIPALLDGIEPQTALDFATGTGRIARLLKERFPGCRVVGADISEKMLAVAKAEGGDVQYLQLDLRNATEQLPSTFDLVTAFRFFPNADLALRSKTADQLSKLIKPGAFLLTNNHRNFWSPTYLIQRLIPRRKPAGMLNRELIDLFTSRGFAVVAHVSLGLSPHTEEKSVIPWSAVRALERANYRWLSRRHSAGYNTLYLFKRLP